MNNNHISVINDATELRRLILEYPELPIAILTNSEVCLDDGYWYATKVTASKGTILDIDAPWNEETTYTNEDDFREDLEEWIWDKYTDIESEPDDAYFQRMVDEQMKIYEPYWKDVIIVWCDN